MAEINEPKISTEDRIRGALWGMFIGDALAMPVHWYYNTNALKKDFGVVTDYEEPKEYHPDSILWRSDPKVSNPKADILGDQKKHYGQRGCHYHKVLKKGENTLNLQVTRVFLRSVAENKQYDADKFLDKYVDYMLTTSNKDTYAEVYHREFFENYGKGKTLKQCAGPEGHDTASVGGFVAMLPMVLYKASQSSLSDTNEDSLSHLRLTHTSKKLEKYATVLVDVLYSIVRESVDVKVASKAASANLNFDVEKLVKKATDDDQVVGGVFSTACYIDSSFPSVLYLANKYGENMKDALISNTNLGGDNCHRGAVLGALLGASIGVKNIPQNWKTGLAHHDDIAEEINNFIEVALKKEQK